VLIVAITLLAGPPRLLRQQAEATPPNRFQGFTGDARNGAVQLNPDFRGA